MSSWEFRWFYKRFSLFCSPTAKVRGLESSAIVKTSEQTGAGPGAGSGAGSGASCGAACGANSGAGSGAGSGASSGEGCGAGFRSRFWSLSKFPAVPEQVLLEQEQVLEQVLEQVPDSSEKARTFEDSAVWQTAQHLSGSRQWCHCLLGGFMPSPAVRELSWAYFFSPLDVAAGR